jgi:hypothetical protein
MPKKVIIPHLQKEVKSVKKVIEVIELIELIKVINLKKTQIKIQILNKREQKIN